MGDKEDFKSVLAEFDGMNLPPFPPLKKNAEERLNAIKDLETRPDDIILAAYPRSGTHWLWEVITMLLQGEAEYTTAIKETAFLEFIPDLNQMNEVKSPRLLNTHVPFRWLPKKLLCNDGRIIHVIRNPKDQAVSMYHFLKGRVEKLAKVSWNEFFEMISKEQVRFYGSWFAYQKEFEKAIKDGTAKRIHTLYYEDLKMNPVREIRLLADFLPVAITDELAEEIANKCAFTNLKEADGTVKQNTSNHYRKGEVGDWKNYFTVSQNEQFDNKYKREMSNSELKVKFEI